MIIFKLSRAGREKIHKLSVIMLEGGNDLRFRPFRIRLTENRFVLLERLNDQKDKNFEFDWHTSVTRD
jgi:hypothetical protein